MVMEHDNLRGTRRVEIERIFESSRLAGELMACAYENLVPIKRHFLNPVREVELSDNFRRLSAMEEQRCAVGM